MSRPNDRWVRINGQQELRDNIESLLRDEGMSRAALCRSADLSYQRISACLRAASWFSETDVEAMAQVFDVSADELLGDGLYRSQYEEFPRFAHRPGTSPDAQTDDDLKKQRLSRGLCCQCGSLRLVHAGWTFSTEFNEPGRTRLVSLAHCGTCDSETKHAVLNLDDNRNTDEERDHAPTRADVARAETSALVTRLAGFNVDVVFRSQRKKRRTEGYATSVEFDDSKSRWRIEVDPNLPPRGQVLAITEAWRMISTGDFGKIDWDPYTTGTLFSLRTDDWAAATDDLVDDIRRFLHVEKVKLVQHHRDQVGGTR